jgi:hypothetical protein
MNHLQPYRLLWALFFLLILVGCRTTPAVTPAASPVPAGEPAPVVSAPTPFALPTLFPTNTPLVWPTPWPTSSLPATAVPRTPIPFAEIVVSLTYEIPALGLQRRLEGNVASQIILTDEVTGETVTLSNQPGNLLQIQETLTRLTLAEPPDGCDRCVFLRYELPARQTQVEGWLQDLIFLASLDHFTSVHLGPHFPAGTVIGLRRNASAFDVAQTLALTADGDLFIWQGVMAEIPPPQPAGPLLAEWRAAVAALPEIDLQRRYAAACPGAPFETLRLSETEIILICPALSLPAVLAPLYQQLDLALAAALPAPKVAPPDYPLTLNDRLLYQQIDGYRLLLDADDQVTIFSGESVVLTTTLTLTNTTGLSLTLALEQSGALMAGVSGLEEEWPAFLIVRGPLAVSSRGWDQAPPNALRPLLTTLDAWIAAQLAPED